MFNKMWNGDPFAIHFHGIHQRGTPRSDGVPNITQYETPVNGNYTYEFPACAEVAGTHLYHSHIGLTTITGHGPLIIHDLIQPKQIQYDEERIIVLSDFWNNTDTDDTLEEGLLGTPFKWVGTPAYLLINGRTNLTNDCGPDIIDVERNKVYRFRIIGAMTLEDVVFTISGHKLTIIEADGTYVNPIETDQLEVGPGQRYSVLVTTNQKTGNYPITAITHLRPDKPFRSALAILNYEKSGLEMEPANMTDPGIIIHSLIALDNYDQRLGSPPSTASRTLKFRGQQLLTLNGGRQWAVNSVSFQDFSSPPLLDLYNGRRPIYTNYSLVSPNGYNASTGTYPLRYNEVIDIVFQNTYGPEGNCDYHPWHTHGHSFWELAYGPGEYPTGYTSLTPEGQIPIYRDTTIIYPAPPGTGNPTEGCGWKLVRYVANNPGIWIVHCHIVPHMIMGMMIAFEEGTDHLLNDTMTQC